MTADGTLYLMCACLGRVADKPAAALDSEVRRDGHSMHAVCSDEGVNATSVANAPLAVC